MTFRFADAGCMPSATAAFHAPPYHAQEMPFADNVSPMVFCVCGGSTPFDGSAKRGSPAVAGATRDGWYGGWFVLSE